MSKISLERFINETKGTKVDFPGASKATKVKGQCVTLVQNYIASCLEQPAVARGNAADWITSYVNEGLGETSAEQRDGDIIVFPNEAEGLGHIGIWVNGQIYDQNNAIHDGGKAGFCDVFSWDFVTLHPNTEVILHEEVPGPVPEPTPAPQPVEITLNVGDAVEIIGTGNGSSNGNSNTAYGIGWNRVILNIWEGRAFPYQVGLDGITTGFYKADALRKI